MQEKREERTKMAEDLEKLQQIHAHLAALEQMALRRPELGLKFTMSGYLRERSQRTRQGS